MAASDFLKRRVEEDKKAVSTKTVVQKPIASDFLQNLAKGSKETPLNASGARVTHDNNSMGLYKAAQRVEGTVSKEAGNFPASPSRGSTLNQMGSITIQKPTMADFRTLTAKKKPTTNINLDNKPVQSHVTVNPTLVTATKKTEPQRSVAKNRKTMLYETNDSLLSDQEILEKYRYVVNDKEMDANTRNLAAKKGLAVTGRMRDKNLFSGKRNSELANEITTLQGDLTYMTKAYARGKGYGDAYGLNYVGNKLSDNFVETSGDTQLQATAEARKKLGQQAAEDNPLSVASGRLMGEGLKYAAFSPLIEGQVAKATSALGAKMGASTAPAVAQQLYALGKYNPAISKGLQFGGNILGQQAADTLLTTPTVVLEGIEAGKSKGQIATDVAKQQAMDLGFNLGFGALESGGKVLNAAAKTKEAQKNISVQMKRSMLGELPSNEYIKLGETPGILKKYGMTDGEMMMPQTVVPKVAYPAEYRQTLAKSSGISDANVKYIQGHNLGFEAIRQIPEKLKKPVAILKSATRDKSIVVLTDMIDAYGQPVIVPLRVGENNFLEFSNVIPTMYGRQGFVDFMKKQKQDGNILYLNKKRNLQKLLDNGLQLPESYSNADPMLSLARKNGKVKDAELKNIGKGNKLETAERELAERMQKVDKTGTQRDLLIETPPLSEGIMTAAELQELGFSGNVKGLLDVENRQALNDELKSLIDGKGIREEYKTIVTQHGKDSPEAKRFIQEKKARKAELAETLGYADNMAFAEESRAVNEALRELKKITGVHGKENTKLSKELLQEAATDVRLHGNISRETKERIFNEMISMGGISNKEVIDQNLKGTLKKTVLRISKMDAANIPDFDQFRKSLFGKIGGISKGEKGEYIDVAYNELHSLFPERFPGDIVHPAEQLEQIAKVADDMKIKQTSLLKTLSKEERASLKESFNASLAKVEGNLQRVTQRQEERRAKQIRKVMASEMKMNMDSLSTKDMEGLFNERYQLRKELERTKKKAALTNSEKLMVTQLLNGDISFDDIGRTAVPNLADMVKRITDVYNAEKQLRQIEGAIGDYRVAKATGRSKMIGDAVGEIRVSTDGKQGWRDMNPSLMGRLTQERILEKVTDKKTAKRIFEKIFEPIHTAERDRQLFMKGITDKVKKLNIDTKKKYGVTVKGLQGVEEQTYELSESGLVHWLGTKRSQLRELERKGNGMSPQEVHAYNRLWAEIKAAESAVSKEQLAKIDKGIQLFQRVYKEIHPKINEVLIRNGYDPIGYIEGYFPSMFFDDAADPMGKALQKLGFDFASKELPMDIAGRTENFRPGKKWAGNLLERTTDKTDYDALRAMDKYLDDISDVIYHTDNIKNLREYEEHLRYTLSPDGVKAEADAIKSNPALSAEEIREKLDKLYEQNGKNHTLQNYVNNIRRYTDLLAGKKHSLDRVLETDVFGRSVYKAVNTLESRIGANMVAGNIGSAITNIIPITQGMSPMSTKSNMKGLKESLQYMFKDGIDDITRKSAFLTTREGREMLYKTGLQKVTDIAVSPMELVDRFTTQAVWRSRFYDNLKKGIDEGKAILEADDYCRRLFAGRSKGAMPTIFHSKAAKPLTMFQLEVNNQLDFLLKDLPKEAHGSAIRAMKIYSGVLLSAYLYNDVYEKLTGRRSALDPIGIANRAVRDFTGTGMRNTIDIAGDIIQGKGLQLTDTAEAKKPSQAVGNLLKDAGGNVPFFGGVVFDGGRIPLSAAIPGVGAGGSMIDSFAGITSGEKAWADVKKDLLNPLYYTIPPFGGGQVRKTIGGLSTMAKGGSYTVTNKGERLQFAVDQSSPTKWAQAGVFGKWALPEAQGYLDGQTKAFSEKRTSTYEKLKEKGIVNLQAYGAIGQVMAAESQEEKRKALRMVPIREEGRAIIYYDLLASDKDRAAMDMLRKLGEDDTAIYECIEQLAGDKTDNRKRNILLESKLSNEAKKYIYREKISKDTDKWLYQYDQAGMKMDDFIQIKNKFVVLKNRSLPTWEKREAFVQWVLQNGYSKEQRDVIYDSFNIAKKYRR
ncbi:MuF-C-terminal domain-containing protein [Anaerotignum sp.]|uniref:MuF-C-terminal domain-containing protein n=1 Tax=Anaerotignum sp. TaxID=2039241 RepID=UPI0028B18D65|nr:hypothetical protein [Anaerotignum sp.]